MSQRKLTSFFSPKRNIEYASGDGESRDGHSSEKKVRSDEVNEIAVTGAEVNDIAVTSVTSSNGNKCVYQTNDISLFVNRKLNENEKLQVLENTWVPQKNYAFPLLDKFQDRKLRFRSQWLEEFHWLVYSEKEEGAYCKFCVVFAHSGGIGSQPLGQLVKCKFDNWKKAKEILRQHGESKYHIDSVIVAENFLKVAKNEVPAITEKLNHDRAEKIKKNRKNIEPIVEAIILCGQQEIALRGHCDSGKIDVDDHKKGFWKNSGNFRSILKYRAKGDDTLRTALEGPGERNKYTSPTVQNEILECCNQVLLRKLAAKVNESKCFSILADETTDVAAMEQLVVCLRYVDDGVIREDFVQFLEANSLTGRDLASTILNGLQECGIDCQYIFGQGYDGASNMSGKFNGVQAIVRESYPAAIYVHCAAHSLNLAISKASEIQPIKNCLGIVEKLYEFFSRPKRKSALCETIEKAQITTSAKSLKRLCATRWCAKYDAVNDFVELLVFVYETLECISLWNDSAATDARLLLNAIDFEFLVSLFTTSEVFSYGQPLCKILQKESIDLKEAVSSAEDAISELERIRQQCDEEFGRIYAKAKEMAERLSIEITMKRVAKMQRNRANFITKSVEEFYKISVFISYIDYFTNQLKERFIAHKTLFEGFGCLFQNDTTINDRFMFEKLVEFYSPSVDKNCYAELRLWKARLAKENVTPKTAIEALQQCDKRVFPNISKLLQILCSLPVSTATPERTFSALKRIKTYLRNSTSQARLNALASLSLHKHIALSASEVIDELARKKRRLEFVL